ncbi:MAG: PAS domain S-box protein [Deltaproteobacteria bacterium]|nr:PAS domain S-box protein [Deltaproteobacteria bacterium]
MARRSTKTVEEKRPPEMQAALTPLETYIPLLADFPDPAILTDRQQKVAFLNRAAETLFGGAIKEGDPCPVCSPDSGLMLKEEVKGALRCAALKGQAVHRAPIVFRDSQARHRSLMVTSTPIRAGSGRPAGCFTVFRDIREDLQTHPKLELQMATLASILENFPMPLFTVDPTLRVTYMNESMEALTGYRRQEVIGKLTCGDVLNTKQCRTEECVLWRVMKTKEPIFGLRRTMVDRQGREIHVMVNASVITDHQGHVIGGFEAVRDITSIVEAEQKIEMFSELTHEGIMMVDAKQRVQFANSMMAKITNLSKEEMIGKDLREVLTPQHRRLSVSLFQQAQYGYWLERHFINTLEPTPDSKGERRVFETWMAVSCIGKNTYNYIFMRDLTNRIKMGRELHKAKNFLENIINRSVDGIVVVDAKGIPLIFNEGAERILGFKAEEVIGHPEVLFRFYPEETAKEMMRRMRSDDYGPRDKLNSTQITFYDKQGKEVPVNFSAAIVREGGREIASVGIFSDLREQLRMRRELEDTQVQLMQAEKIASLGRLSAGVAHEINNPLAGILIYAELLERQLQNGSFDREYLTEIINQTLRCQQIVTRLLEFSRQSLGQKTYFDVNDTIFRCIDLISHQAIFHNIEIKTEAAPDLPRILGDPGQLQQVFTNLLLNAADAMQGQGKITVVSRPTPARDGIILTFTDTGCGMPPEVRDKIFEPFFTTKAPGKGTGLGLSIVYSVIQRHGGTIEVDSAPGGGTTFTIRLPLEAPPEMAQFDFV